MKQYPLNEATRKIDRTALRELGSYAHPQQNKDLTTMDSALLDILRGHFLSPYRFLFLFL